MNLILLGAPGAGKGTQAEIISDTLHIPAISTGNMMRGAVKNGTEMGKQAKAFMDRGELVPDEVVNGIVRERLNADDCKDGFILDGFPRTIPQAEALDQMGVRIDRVIEIKVADEAIEERLSGRRVCEACGASYHIQNKPSLLADICDKCGGKLVIRKDDRPETIHERLKGYHDMTEPLKDYYAHTNKLRVVEGHGTVSDITKQMLAALEA